jgi:hypothetical protein
MALVFFGESEWRQKPLLHADIKKPPCGAYTSMPHPFFGAKDVCYIEKKVAKKKASWPSELVLYIYNKHYMI